MPSLTKAEIAWRIIHGISIRRPRKSIKFSDVNKEWIDSLRKTINENGCWIPITKPSERGYCQIGIKGVVYRLSRLVVSVYYNLNYHDIRWQTRHSSGCDKRCFWIEHLKPGTASENENDKILHGTHYQLLKKVCPKCGGPYSNTWLKHGPHKGKVFRYCSNCSNERRRKRYDTTRKDS